MDGEHEDEPSGTQKGAVTEEEPDFSDGLYETETETDTSSEIEDDLDS